MHRHEVILIFQPDLDEAGLTAVLEKVKGWIIDSGGSIDKVDNWGKREMAYQIRKQREGHYVLLSGQFGKNINAELERNLRITEQVLRFMIIKVE